MHIILSFFVSNNMFKTDLTKFSVLGDQGDIVAHLEVILLGTSGLWEGVLWCKYFH